MLTQLKINELREEFLRSGGTFLRRGTSKEGEPIILQKKYGFKTYKLRLTFTKAEFRDRTFKHLIRQHKNQFKSDE
jgi:hypothetical protein